MRSRTKYPLDHAMITQLFREAGISGVADIAPLGAGEYNAVFSARAQGREYVLKVAPARDVPVLTHERGMMAAEVFWYRQMRENTSIRVPQVFAQDFGRKLIPADYFIMEKLTGKQMDQMDFTKEEKAQTNAVLARMAAQIHQIRNDRFGFIQNGLHEDWYQAIRSIVSNLLKDCAAQGKRSRRGEKLLGYIDQKRTVLERAECCMVNTDIWAPNIICTRRDGGVEYAWIDPERSFWGDRMLDFLCLEMMKPLGEKKDSLAAYNAAAETPVLDTAENRIRYAVGQGYMGLVMEVEKYYRYTPSHFGWWRNVFASAWYFREAFKVLGHG
ncbi:MAG: aminoglycoside phosphotransferase family protein [Clostridiales bacterium]|nr:aminoglycoside phosphotransferase family protein [Clostridiales bacterium]